MKKFKQKLMNVMVIAGLIAIQTNAQAQCELKVRLDVTPVLCKSSCTGTATAVDLDHTVPLEFLWSTGATTQSISGLCTGDVTLTVWQGENCKFILKSFIDEPTELMVSCTSTVAVAPGTITTNTTGGTIPYGYVWNTNPVQTTNNITNLPAGSYMVIVTDANGCSAKTSCDITTPQNCNARTQTQGGWGAPPNGHNPATYLYANFTGAFPNGITVGCNNQLKLTTKQAVTDFLPSGSTARTLPAGTLVNPGGAYNNVLAGQVVALTISVGFDNYDVNFGTSPVSLGNHVIATGLFAGWTVNALLAEANKKLGGCASNYSFSNLNNAVSSVNKNYVDGTVDNHYLNCSGNQKEEMIVSGESFNYSVNPNPASQQTALKMFSVKNEQISVDIYNIVGKKVATIYNEYVQTQQEIKVNINTSDLVDGIYIINIHTSEKSYQKKLVVRK